MCPLRALRVSVVRNALKTVSPLRHREHREHRDCSGNQTRTLSSISQKIVGSERHFMNQLSHIDNEGRIRMVDTGDKPVSARRAVASARVLMSPETAAA